MYDDLGTGWYGAQHPAVNMMEVLDQTDFIRMWGMTSWMEARLKRTKTAVALGVGDVRG